MNLPEAERLIEASPDYRLLRRVPPPSQWALTPAAETRRAVFVDVETTGLDQDSDEVIELALLPFEYDRNSGLISAVDERVALSAFRQPSIPIPPESTRIHGIKDEDVAGRSISDEAVRAIIEPTHLIIAHNAAFDRPMVEKHWPVFAEKHWACSIADIDWKTEGISSAKLDYVLMRQGWFHDGHRALSDAAAALFLLTRMLPETKQPALKSLLDCARRQLWAVRAEDSAFEQRAILKARGYRWDEGDGNRPKSWWILTSEPEVEIEWLQEEIYRDRRDIAVVKASATRRYSLRFWGP